MANKLSLTGGAQVVSNTDGAGQGGSVTVTAADSMSISGSGGGLFSTASNTGNAGEITVSAPADVDDGRWRNDLGGDSGAGNAGNISLSVSNLTLDRRGAGCEQHDGAGKVGV